MFRQMVHIGFKEASPGCSSVDRPLLVVHGTSSRATPPINLFGGVLFTREAASWCQVRSLHDGRSVTAELDLGATCPKTSEQGKVCSTYVRNGSPRIVPTCFMPHLSQIPWEHRGEVPCCLLSSWSEWKLIPAIDGPGFQDLN